MPAEPRPPQHLQEPFHEYVDWLATHPEEVPRDDPRDVYQLARDEWDDPRVDEKRGRFKLHYTAKVRHYEREFEAYQRELALYDRSMVNARAETRELPPPPPQREGGVGGFTSING